MKKIFLTLFFVLAFFLCGCATTLCGDHAKVTISSTKASTIKVFSSQNHLVAKGKSPLTVNLKTSTQVYVLNKQESAPAEYKILITAADDKKEDVFFITSRLSKVARYGNLALLPLYFFGAAMDYHSGAIYTFEDNYVFDLDIE